MGFSVFSSLQGGTSHISGPHGYDVANPATSEPEMGRGEDTAWTEVLGPRLWRSRNDTDREAEAPR